MVLWTPGSVKFVMLLMERSVHKAFMPVMPYFNIQDQLVMPSAKRCNIHSYCLCGRVCIVMLVVHGCPLFNFTPTLIAALH